MKGLVKPLIKGGINSPKGLAYAPHPANGRRLASQDPHHSRIFVADPGLRRPVWGWS